MKRNEYLAGVNELYQGEVIGEGLTSSLLATCAPEQKLIISLLLQVESEAKIRLRPFLYRLGLSLQEDEQLRASGIAFAATLKDVPWQTAVTPLAELSKPYLERYRALLAAAPDSDRDYVAYMVAHEEAIINYFELEAQGKGREGMPDLLALLNYPLPTGAVRG
jgi:hypothetical protein